MATHNGNGSLSNRSENGDVRQNGRIRDKSLGVENINPAFEHDTYAYNPDPYTSTPEVAFRKFPPPYSSESDPIATPNAVSSNGNLNSHNHFSTKRRRSKSSVYDNDKCGLICWYPSCLQVCAHPLAVVVFLCGVVISQSLVETGLLNSINTTLEKRFQVKSSDIGAIFAVYEAVSVFCTLFISYFGHRTNRARLIGYMALLIMVGYAIFLLPHFINSDYMPRNSTGDTCVPGTNKADDVCDANNNPNLQAIGLFCFAQIFVAIGASPIYVLGPTYLWDNLTAKQYPIYASFIYVCAALGPAMGFVFGGVFLDLYIDWPSPAPVGLNSSSRQWLGAWWIGIAMMVGFVLIVAVPLMCFPSKLPKRGKAKNVENKGQDNPSLSTSDVHKALKTSPQRIQEITPAITLADSKIPPPSPSISPPVNSLNEAIGGLYDAVLPADDPTTEANGNGTVGIRRRKSTLEDSKVAKTIPTPESKMGSIKEFPRGIKRMLTNPIWVGITMLTVVENLISNAFVNYVSKYLQSMYRIPAYLSSYMTGGVVVPSAVAGILFGGLLMNKLRLGTLGASKLLLGLCLATTTCTFVLMCLGCPSPSLIGTNTPYFDASPNSPFTLNATCNANCGCSSFNYNPVCAGETDTYFNLCFAGCEHLFDENDEMLYSNCSCTGNVTIKEGICSTGCPMLYPALVFVFLQVFLTSTGLMPANIITLSCVSSDDNSFSLGSQLILVRLLGFIPGPPIFGHLFDKMCIIREKTCQGGGACLEYDLNNLAYLFLGSLCGLKVVGIICASVTFFFSRKYAALDLDQERTAESTGEPSQLANRKSAVASDQDANYVTVIKVTRDLKPTEEDVTRETSLSSSSYS